MIIKKLRQLFCLHKHKECITNIYGDMVNLLSTKHKIYRSVWKCKDCGKIFYESSLCNSCKVSNWYEKL